MCLSHSSLGQQRLTLNDAISQARVYSPAALQAANSLTRSFWSYRTFQSNYLPQLVLTGTLPEYNRAIDQIIQPDGSLAFRTRSIASSYTGLNLNQAVGPLGGNVFVSTDVSRIDNLISNTRSYQASPFIIGYNQPLFRFNRLRWDRKIEPLRYEEARRQYAEDMENVAVETTNLFFNLALAQANLSIARQNQMATDTLYKIAQGRYNLGKIAENELLQLELSLMNAQQDVQAGELGVKQANLRLKVYLGQTNKENYVAVLPDTIPVIVANEEMALAEARKNRGVTLAFQRRVLEANQQVAQAFGESGFTGDLRASYGLTQSAATVTDLYNNAQDQQRVALTFSIPVLDWGRTRSRRKTALANENLIKSVVQQQELNFNQEIQLAVQLFSMNSGRLRIAQRSSEVALKRYEIAKQRFLIGKIGITDLNIAQQEKDLARRNYMEALRTYWTGYYDLRRLTLYDFAANRIISYETEAASR